MKKLVTFILAVIMLSGTIANAQNSAESGSWNRSGVFAELGLGVACGDIDADLGLSLGLGYRYHLGNGFNWDVLRVAYYVPTATSDFGEGSSLRILSGIRYNSAPLLGNMPLYANFAAGYQMNVKDFDYWHGFAYEFGVGVMLSRHASLGLMWEGDVAYYNLGFASTNVNFGIFGVKLGLQF